MLLDSFVNNYFSLYVPVSTIRSEKSITILNTRKQIATVLLWAILSAVIVTVLFFTTGFGTGSE